MGTFKIILLLFIASLMVLPDLNNSTSIRKKVKFLNPHNPIASKNLVKLLKATLKEPKQHVQPQVSLESVYLNNSTHLDKSYNLTTNLTANETATFRGPVVNKLFEEILEELKKPKEVLVFRKLVNNSAAIHHKHNSTHSTTNTSRPVANDEAVQLFESNSSDLPKEDDERDYVIYDDPVVYPLVYPYVYPYSYVDYTDGAAVLSKVNFMLYLGILMMMFVFI